MNLDKSLLVVKFEGFFGNMLQVTQMAKYLTSVYVSGWQCSSTASTSNEPGPDVADYPYDTVPNKARLVRFRIPRLLLTVCAVMLEFMLEASG